MCIGICARNCIWCQLLVIRRVSGICVPVTVSVSIAVSVHASVSASVSVSVLVTVYCCFRHPGARPPPSPQRLQLPFCGKGWGVVLQIARQSGRHDDTRRDWWVVGQMEWRARHASSRSRCSPPERRRCPVKDEDLITATSRHSLSHSAVTLLSSACREVCIRCLLVQGLTDNHSCLCQPPRRLSLPHRSCLSQVDAP